MKLVILIAGIFILIVLLVIVVSLAWMSGRTSLPADDDRQMEFIREYNRPGHTVETGDRKRLIRLQHWHVVNLGLVVYDILAVNIAYLFALWIRFDCQFSAIPEKFLTAFGRLAPVYTIFCIAVFAVLRLYKSIWRFVSYSELLRVAASSAITFFFQVAGIALLIGRMPYSYYFIGTILQFLAVLCIRFSYRFVLLERGARSKRASGANSRRVMLIGAGKAGQMILRDVMNAKEITDSVCCIIDDNSNKWNRFIEGIPVVGGREDILANVEKYKIDKIFIAIPSATAEEKRDILNICKETGCELKNLPGIYQLASGEVTVASMKDVSVEDLLGREPIQVDLEQIFRHLYGKTILVTGGGGSIGSELCRQIAGHEPKRLIIFDVYENNAYDIEQELKDRYPALDLVVLIGSVQDSRRINSVFETYRPDIVYHAAAHKHVPLMEGSPCEAIKNNVIGTYKTAYAAMKNGCGRFVLISTDKAVNPTNVMGASKRLCEMVIQLFDRMVKEGKEERLPVLHVHRVNEAGRWRTVSGTLAGGKSGVMAGAESAGVSGDTFHGTYDGVSKAKPDGPSESAFRSVSGAKPDEPSESAFRSVSGAKPVSGGKREDHKLRARTEFVAVRFGNVLGSNGSVIPLFKKQIAKGGPVTVTHPDIIRYFMTIPEAVGLVLQAGTYAKGGEIFILDMGVPMKIDTLARNLIKLSGYKPDVDIRIEYTGLRPGEKLYEEKLMAEEGLKTTPNHLIHIGKPIPVDADTFLTQLEELMYASYENRRNVRKLIARMVPTYCPAGGAEERAERIWQDDAGDGGDGGEQDRLSRLAESAGKRIVESITA